MTNNPLSSLRKDAKFVKEISERVSTLPRKLETEETCEKIRDLAKTRKNHGDKLMKIGVAMIICPDPVSSVAGVPLVIAGKLLRSRQSISMKDVFSDLNRTMNSLSSFRFD